MVARNKIMLFTLAAAILCVIPAPTQSAIGFCKAVGTHVVYVPGSAGPGTAKTQIVNVCSATGLVTAGDSLNYRVGAAAIASLQPIDLLEAEIGGTTCLQSVGTYPTYDALGYDARRSRNVVALGCGLISLNQGRTTAQTYADILAYLALAEVTGFNHRFVWTLTDAEPLSETIRGDLNTLIRDGAIAHNYTVLDVGADPDLGCDGCAENRTFFDSDGIHYTEAGISLKATYETSALQAIGAL